MYRYKVFGEDAEVYGKAMLAFTESINYQNLKPILEKHRLTEIDPERWYPQQVWLDVFNDVVETTNSISNLVSIGMKIAETAMLPSSSEVSFIDLMLGFGEMSYKANNRGSDIGYIETRVVDDHHLIMIDATPYPDEFVYGAYYGVARRFLPEGTALTVRYDDESPRRSQGGETTIIHIEWD